jgi:CubicO group peptidase (beta-lactamase class C family)
VTRLWYRKWGATDEEVQRSLPGDELVPHPRSEFTCAITIQAAGAKISFGAKCLNPDTPFYTRRKRMNRLIRRISMTVGILVGVLVVAVLGLYILKPKAPKPPGDLSSISELEDYLEQVVAAEHPPGLSVAVVKDGRMVYANGFGVADGPRNVLATKDSVYHWWSMTKIPTAVAVMQLHERGLLDIDDPISNYLPFFKVSYKGAAQANISIRQVLNHTAGLPDAMPDIITWLHSEGDPPVDQTELVLDKFSEYDELIFLPGEKSRYSNWGYMVLGALIEAVSGKTYEAYIVDNILLPLDMQNTNFVYTESMAENEATGSQHLVDLFTPFFPIFGLNYTIREKVGMRYWFNRVYNDQTPPTGLIGPVTDMALFMIAYLDDGESILQTETISLMNDVLETASQPDDPVQGLGWRAHLTTDGRRYLTHSGGGPGFSTIFRIYPGENLGVVVMGNDTTIDRETLADVLADVDWR